MLHPLVYADVHESSGSTMHMVLLMVLWLGVIAVLAVIPIFQALRRRHRFAGAIMVIVLFCALIAGVSACATISAQDKWSQENAVLLQFSDNNRPGSPAMPVGLWIGLAAVYAGVMIWTFMGTAAANPRPTREDQRNDQPRDGGE